MPGAKPQGKQRGVTSQDVAREAGVSRSTVSVVLNNNKNVAISPDTYEKVILAARRLNYRPNVAARAVCTRRAYSVGLVSCWDPVSPLFARPVQGMLKHLSTQNYGLTVCDVAAPNVEQGVETAINYYQEGRVDGVVFVLKSLGATGFPQHLTQALRTAQVPFVLINSFIDDPTVDDISPDNFQAGYQATQHLIQLGHRKIAFLLQRCDLKVKPRAEDERLKGYLAACNEAQIKVDGMIVQSSAGISVDTGYRAFTHMLSQCGKLPTAVYAVSDYLAIGAMYAAQEAGIKVPQQLAVVGTDDLDMAKQLRPPLTSVAQPLHRMGEEAMKLLLARINGSGPENAVQIKLPCELIIRESCGATRST